MGTAPARTVRLRSGARLTIRPAHPDDAAALVELAHHMSRTSDHNVTKAGEFDLDEPAERRWIQDHLDSPVKVALVGEVDARIVGLINFAGHPRWRMAHHGMFGVGVEEGWRGRGVGRELIAALLDWAVHRPDLEEVHLGVFETNAGARRLYERVGFVEFARRPRFFRTAPGVYVDDILMVMFVKPGLAPRGYNTWPRPEQGRARNQGKTP